MRIYNKIKSIYFLLFFVLIFFGSTKNVFAQNNTEYYKGVVKEVKDETLPDNLLSQKVLIEVLEGPEKGKFFNVDYSKLNGLNTKDKLSINDQVVLEKIINTNNESNYYISDKYRLNNLIYIFVFFILISFIFAKFKAITSLLGLAISFTIIFTFIIPNILNGSNPIFISLFGAFLIAVFSIYLAHGINKNTTIALISTLLTLSLATLMSFLFVGLAKLSGTGNEESMFLQLGSTSNINLYGLLLGGIIIGTLGVLDDVTTAQVAAVDEIYKANKNLKFLDLYKRGLNIGKEHIAALINTLVLAYAGASLPLMLLFFINTSVPVWVTINSEFIAEEIVRTIVGSSSLVLAVPISTLLSSFFKNR